MSGNIPTEATSSGVVDPDTFVLYIWPGEWDLPSLDPECLCALSYLKFANVKHKIVAVDSAVQLFKNDYPRLEFKNETFVGLDSILERIKREKNIESGLSDNNYVDSLAMVNLFKEKFIPAFNALCWLDEENTYAVIRRAYGRYVRFPLSVFKLRSMSQHHENLIMCNYRPSHIQFDGIKHHIVSDAKECLNIMASKLGDNLFMFENRPTLVDAYLFAYLGILHKAPFVASQLKTHLTATTNLCSLVDRTQKDFFAPENKDLQGQKRKTGGADDAAAARSTPESNKRLWSVLVNFLGGGGNAEEAEKRKQQLVAVSVGMLAMLTYAIAVGFIKIDIINTKIEYIETNDQ